MTSVLSVNNISTYSSEKFLSQLYFLKPNFKLEPLFSLKQNKIWSFCEQYMNPFFWKTIIYYLIFLGFSCNCLWLLFSLWKYINLLFCSWLKFILTCFSLWNLKNIIWFFCAFFKLFCSLWKTYKLILLWLTAINFDFCSFCEHCVQTLTG